MEPKKNIQDYNQDPSIEFSIAVLCYRTEEEIIPFIEKLHHVMNLFRFEWEIVLVANYWKNTKDLTPEIAKKLSEKLDHVRYIAESKEGGMGWDMKRGLDACKGTYIGVIDGDGQFPVESIFSCFAKIKSEEVDFVQMAYSIGERAVEDKLLPVAAERGIAVIVNRPFEGGQLFNSVRGEDVPEWAIETGCKTWGQFFLKFVLSHPTVTCAIPATSDPSHMIENLWSARGNLPDEATRQKMVQYWEDV